ncbi:MAG: bacteriophage integrase [Bacteroidetes bacterium]|nr:MAG: bacteriophage integrase [Bacteroidota bacterium]
MQRATFKVLFYVKHTKQLKDGTLPIFVRITVNNSRLEFGLQRSVGIGQWDSVKGMAKGKTKQIIEMNAYLETVKTNLYIKKRELEETGIGVTTESLKIAYMGLAVTQHTVLEVFKEHNENCKQLVNIDFAPGTIVKYQTTLKHLEYFIKKKMQRKDLSLPEVNAIFIKNFEIYLKTEGGCAHNSAVKHLTNLKKIMRSTVANGWLKVDPFANISFKLEDVDLDFLDEKELDMLIKKVFTIERIQQVKDVYIFCCFTGLAFVDVHSLCQQDLIENDGKIWIKKKRQKTKNWCNIPLLKPALEILEKYKDNPVCLKKGLLLPVLSNQKMNAYLKEIADLVGINKHLSTHTARHTFATTVTLGNQVSMEVVSKMLGHSSMEMTKRYARVVDDLINKDMQKVKLKFEHAMSASN